MKFKCKSNNKEFDGEWMGCCHYYPDCSMGDNPNRRCGCSCFITEVKQ